MKNYKHNPVLPTVIVTKEQGTMIRMPNGDLIRGIIFTRVDDHMDKQTTVIVKMQCNLEFTEE